MITVDFLKHNCQRIYFFGLGFIQVKLTDALRVHFYTTRWNSTVHDLEVHNHRYNFSSRILKGTLINRIYDFVPDPSGIYTKEFVSCGQDVRPWENTTTGRLVCTRSENQTIGKLYTMKHNQFHMVDALEDTITMVIRSEPTKTYAEIVRGKEPSECPFSYKVSELELWETIEEMLK